MKSHQRNKREHGVAFEPRGGSRDWVLLSELLPTLSSLDVEWFLVSIPRVPSWIRDGFRRHHSTQTDFSSFSVFFPARDWKVKRDESWPRRDRQAADLTALEFYHMVIRCHRP